MKYSLNVKEFYKALLIRVVENKLLDLFSNGKISGTVHTCVGQEFSALAFAGKLTPFDNLVTNHRGHGHFIAYFDEYKDLIAEILGKANGVCGGIGSSQHLQKGNFFSNGIQGGTVPVAAGMALAEKIKKSENITILFIGDGTLGEGIVYETLNICSLWDLPLLIVCENNQYAQSTHELLNRSGDILKRAEAFGIESKNSNIWELEQLYVDAGDSIEYVRQNRKPLFHLVDLYRLNAHSKGDDNRNPEELEKYRKIDPINVFKNEDPVNYKIYYNELVSAVDEVIKEVEDSEVLELYDYVEENIMDYDEINWEEKEIVKKDRQVHILNKWFKSALKEEESIVLLGEDIKSPYGGAFKVYNELSDLYPERVLTTPISEAAIVGIGNGLALKGMKPIVEIMFGDFITLAFDQLVNHASKFYHMYNKRISCPIIVRTPMGGGRGYGPTHSQSLEKFLIGIDNVNVLALNTFLDPDKIYETVLKETHPVIIIENKIDYGKKIEIPALSNYQIEISKEKYPTVRIFPSKASPTLSIVTYGNSEQVLALIYDIIEDLDLIPEILVITKINPIEIKPISDSVEKSKKLLVIEHGNETGGIGSQILLLLKRHNLSEFKAQCLGAMPYPIPACKHLENEVLINKYRIINAIERLRDE